VPIFAPTHDRFLFTTVAARRAQQLLRGAAPRVQPTSTRSRATRIAQEEVIRGLVAFRLPTQAGIDHGIRLIGTSAELTPAPIAVRGGVSAVVTTPEAVMSLQAATLSGTVSSLHDALSEKNRRFLGWRVWQTPESAFEELHSTNSDAANPRDELALLRSALGLFRSAWVADAEDHDDLVMTLTVKRAEVGELAMDASEPVFAAYPGSLSLTIAGKLVKPVSWVVTLSLRGGVSRSVLARSIREKLRVRALRRTDVEILPELQEVTIGDLEKASGLVIFVHGLLSTDIGTFDSLIDRVRMLAPSALRVGFAHDTLTSIEVNAQELAKWLIDAVGFDHQTSRVDRNLPIVFICHSRGGLVARAAAAQLLEVHAVWRQLLRGAVTFGTPHRGAALAEAPEQMAAVVTMISVINGCGTVMSAAEVLAYVRNGGTFEGIRDLQPAEGAKDSSVSFLKMLQGVELRVGQVPRLAFGGNAPSDTLISRIVGRALGTAAHDYVVERSSSIPNGLTGIGTTCNHFEYFATTESNKSNLDRAARQTKDWLM
jgi:pimeloyl-ACP methyl ester carboxylesterase/DNA-directed RNA polymerase subunit K/omega